MLIHSSFQYSYLWLPLIGFTIGLIATMIGGNGGSIFPPVLILFFGVAPQIAVATSLASVLPIGLAGTISHSRKGNIHLKTGIIFIIFGFAGALSGAHIISMLSPGLLKNIFGIYIICLALFILVSSLRRKTDQDNTPVNRPGSGIPGTSKCSVFGFLAGIVTGLFGTSGTAPVLTGLVALKLPVKGIAGTCLLVVFVNSISGLAGHVLLGEIDLTLVLWLGSGSVLGALAGPKLMDHFNSERIDNIIENPKKKLIYIITSVIILLGILMIIN